MEELERIVAAMMTVMLGMRSTGIVTRTIRDVDDRIDEDGVLHQNGLVWTEEKTPAGTRRVAVPDNMRPFLSVLVKDKSPDAPLFPTGRSG